MKRYLIALALFSAAALAAGSLTAEEKKTDAKNDAKLAKGELAKMMKSIHRGEKASYARVQAELKKDSPDWEVIAKESKSFTEMSTAFKKAELGYTSPAKYIESEKALSKAATDKDLKAANAAFSGLTQSCSACHYGGARAMLKDK